MHTRRTFAVTFAVVTLVRYGLPHRLPSSEFFITVGSGYLYRTVTTRSLPLPQFHTVTTTHSPLPFTVDSVHYLTRLRCYVTAVWFARLRTRLRIRLRSAVAVAVTRLRTRRLPVWFFTCTARLLRFGCTAYIHAFCSVYTVYALRLPLVAVPCRCLVRVTFAFWLPRVLRLPRTLHTAPFATHTFIYRSYYVTLVTAGSRTVPVILVRTFAYTRSAAVAFAVLTRLFHSSGSPYAVLHTVLVHSLRFCRLPLHGSHVCSAAFTALRLRFWLRAPHATPAVYAPGHGLHWFPRLPPFTTHRLRATFTHVRVLVHCLVTFCCAVALCRSLLRLRCSRTLPFTIHHYPCLVLRRYTRLDYALRLYRFWVGLILLVGSFYTAAVPTFVTVVPFTHLRLHTLLLLYRLPLRLRLPFTHTVRWFTHCTFGCLHGLPRFTLVTRFIYGWLLPHLRGLPFTHVIPHTAAVRLPHVRSRGSRSPVAATVTYTFTLVGYTHIPAVTGYVLHCCGYTVLLPHTLLLRCTRLRLHLAFTAHPVGSFLHIPVRYRLRCCWIHTPHTGYTFTLRLFCYTAGYGAVLPIATHSLRCGWLLRAGYVTAVPYAFAHLYYLLGCYPLPVAGCGCLHIPPLHATQLIPFVRLGSRLRCVTVTLLPGSLCAAHYVGCYLRFTARLVWMPLYVTFTPFCVCRLPAVTVLTAFTGCWFAIPRSVPHRVWFTRSYLLRSGCSSTTHAVYLHTYIWLFTVAIPF